MNAAIEIVIASVGAGACGALFSHLTHRPAKRHRGGHRPIWRRGPRVDPYTPTDVPLKALDLSGAPTETIPTTPEGEQ
ncbi:hypothetical protein [Streptomyces sp. NBC_00687]|uniref:hypothetical protein n=1 Tax=Streptomyces sp. NBC_00687 TaxID=2975807 RepID=UPI002250E012|nr:hypothetical protein [Streptomyces sp. NBC_00687]MCX4912844.1 hypothetical protein [Streptomyces sp. NBC_00687]